MRKSFNSWKLSLLLFLLYAQAGLLAVLAVYEAFQPATVSQGFAWFIIGFLAVLAVLVGFLARALKQGARWARGPVGTIEMFVALTGVWLFQDDLVVTGGIALLTSVPIIVLLMHKEVIAWTTQSPPKSPEAS